MKIIEIEKDYINHLRNFDKFVLKPEGNDYKKERKYLGVVFSCDSFDYFIPFSSPDKKDDYDKDGNIRKSSMVVIRMIDEKEKEVLLGTLRLNSMIPIKDKDVIKEYDILQENDTFYKNLLFKELNFIKKNKKRIITKAKKLYDLKVSDSKIPMLNFVCDFKLLEEKSSEYVRKTKTREVRSRIRSSRENER